jgi:hypothetical protein
LPCPETEAGWSACSCEQTHSMRAQ